jgi:hypothetical protein
VSCQGKLELEELAERCQTKTIISTHIAKIIEIEIEIMINEKNITKIITTHTP